MSEAIYRVDAVLTGIVAPPGDKGKLSASGKVESWASRLDAPSSRTSTGKQVA